MPTGEQGDNNETFLRAFVSHEEALRAYARSLLPNWEAVDEVIQEASVVMWRKFDQLESEHGFLAWAKVIVRFEALKARRNVARDRLWFSEDLIELIGAEESPSQSEENLDLERTALKNCLEKLSQSQRELVLLPYREHGAIVKLAKKMKRSVNSYYKQIGRIRLKLTACIQSELGGGQPT